MSNGPPPALPAHASNAFRVLCVIPYAARDAKQALELLDWVEYLGTHQNNGCVLVAANNVPEPVKEEMLARAERIFRSADQIQPDRPLIDEAWPFGANLLFLTAAKWIAQNFPRPFWWNEPDAIPLRPDWLAKLELAYLKGRRRYLGTVVAEKMLNGVALYPPDVLRDMSGFNLAKSEPWDYWLGMRAVSECVNSDLVQHFFGQVGLAPTFRQFHEKGEPPNTFTLEQIKRPAVVFHRNKDSTLIPLLKSCLRFRPTITPEISETFPTPCLQ